MAPADKDAPPSSDEGDAVTEQAPAASGPIPWSLGASSSGEPQEDPVAPLHRGDQVGRYIVTEAIGEGGMGVVYAAFDPELDRKVAVKLLRSRARDAAAQGRLLREAQAMARIAHPNVIPVFDAGTYADQVFVAMELVRGVTLRKWLKQQQRSWREVVAVFRAAGEGLAAAHEAGLVHRDFKPENVLIGEDGRVRVMDFGLAVRDDAPSPDEPRSPPAREDDSGESAGRLSTRYTQAGQIMGTPQYMAPEQHLGKNADARSDQFSFSAALYWGLYRQRPFDPQRLVAAAVDASDDTTASQRAGSRTRMISVSVVEPPPRDAKVPAWLRRAVLRGLGFFPDDRFPTMRAFLAELDRGQRKRRNAWLSASAGATALVVSGLSLSGVFAPRTLCTGAEERLVGIWDPAKRAALRQIFSGTPGMNGEALFGAVRARLDDYAADWTTMHREACLAARVRGEQTELQLASRMVCLDRNLKQLRAVTGLVVEGADARQLEGAVDAVHALPSLARCADLAALADTRLPPDDPVSRPKVERLGSLLAEARALDDSGNFKLSAERAQQAMELARELDHAPLLAEALDALGWVQMKGGDPRLGETNLAEAAFVALRGGHDEEVAQSAARLVYGVGVAQKRFDEGHTWARLARAALDRIGGREVVEIDLLNNHGSLYLVQQRPELAQEPYEKAAALAERVLGPLHPKRAVALTGLGLVYTRRDNPSAAEPVLLRALEMIEKVRGPDHPRAAYTHRSLAGVYRGLKRWPQALFHAQRALEIWEKALGPTHTTAGDAHETFAAIYEAQGKDEECLGSARRALEIKERALGNTSPALAYATLQAGEALLRLSRPREAMGYFDRALGLKGASDSNVSRAQFGMARALVAAKSDLHRARVLLDRAEAARRQADDQEAVEEIRKWRAEVPELRAGVR